jgi:membrane-associated phospholipid phosphatase
VFKWSPAVLLLVTGDLRLSRKKAFLRRAVVLATAQSVLNAIVQPVKRGTKKVRPNGSIHLNSFPSGHTATAFCGAELLRQEIKDQYPLRSYSGYAAAVTTGILRLAKQKHWVSDVIGGAIIGVAAAKMAISILRFWARRHSVENER